MVHFVKLKTRTGDWYINRESILRMSYDKNRDTTNIAFNVTDTDGALLTWNVPGNVIDKIIDPYSEEDSEF